MADAIPCHTKLTPLPLVLTPVTPSPYELLSVLPYSSQHALVFLRAKENACGK